MSSGNDEMEAEVDAEEIQEAVEAKPDFRYALRKFRKDNPSEIFAMHKFSLS